MLADELQKLQNLYEQGAIDATEYAAIKQRLLKTGQAAKSDDLFGMSLPSYNAMLHASQYASYLLPYIGLAVPFILWLRVRDRYPEVDAHGKCAVNWIITELIFATILVLLGIACFFGGLAAGFMATNHNSATATAIWFGSFFVIGGGFSLIKLLSFIFPLIAAVRALDGRTFQYPFAIRFLK
jgi:uncharacterized protein